MISPERNRIGCLFLFPSFFFNVVFTLINIFKGSDLWYLFIQNFFLFFLAFLKFTENERTFGRQFFFSKRILKSQGLFEKVLKQFTNH